MAVRSQQEAQAVMAAYDFSGYERVVDVGGGRGVLLAAILEAAPGLRGLLFDLPGVIGQAEEHLATSSVRERCELVTGSFFDAVPAGGDLYVLSRVIHDWDDAEAARILERCREVMTEEATLLLVEAPLPERVLDQPGAVRMDLHMFTLLHGRERTVPEYEAVLAEAGFDRMDVVPTNSPVGLGVLKARPRPQDGSR
jgi:hypothetical protein